MEVRQIEVHVLCVPIPNLERVFDGGVERWPTVGVNRMIAAVDAKCNPGVAVVLFERLRAVANSSELKMAFLFGTTVCFICSSA